MRVGSFLKENQIILDMKSRTKEEAIKELAGVLTNAPEITDFERFLNDVFEREGMATTGIGHEIAIPHTRSDVVKEFVIAFGRSLDGVEFGSLDGRSVKLIFLMGTPKEKGLGDYLKVLAHLTRLLEKENFRQLLLDAKTPTEVINIFQQAED